MILATTSDQKNSCPCKGAPDNPPKGLDVILSEAKNLVDPTTYTFEILRLPPQNDTTKQPSQWVKIPSREYDLHQSWYGYCYEIEALARQKNYYFRISMLFSLDIAGGCIVNVREVVLHPHQDPCCEKKGGGAGVVVFHSVGPYVYTGE